MRIGVSVRMIEVNKKDCYVLYSRYINLFHGCEFVVILPNQSETILSLCDAFILTGGDDLNPKLYNEMNYSSINVNNKIDEVDFAILEHSIKYNKKVLCICRGIQSLNVFYKGSLTQKINNHMKCNHYINQIKEDYIFDIGKRALVNSYHNQCINLVGEELIVLYTSDDGVIEVMCNKKRNILGVQFHPELNFDEYKIVIEKFLFRK